MASKQASSAAQILAKAHDTLIVAFVVYANVGDRAWGSFITSTRHWSCGMF